MTNAEQWSRVRALFDELIGLDEARLNARLRELKAEQPDIAAELTELLASHAGAHQWFGEMAADLGRQRAAEIDASWAQNRTIGPYALNGLLGTGGMGSVFRAQRADGELDREVALKVVPAGLDSPQAIQRFASERDILASLSHPNIAQLLDAGVSEDGKPWFAMEFVSGQPITNWCDARQLSLRQRVELFLQLANAVQFAHRNLIVHRDLKPSNVLVTGDGQVKLLDFGIAKMLDEDAAATATASRLLTPAYAAPEQLQGQRLSTATDVWALGVILHELLTGLRPRNSGISGTTDTTETMAPSRLVSALNSGRLDTDEADGERLAAVRGSKPDGLSRSLKGDLDVIVLKSLSQEPERRYPSAGQMADDLRRYVAGQPISARPDSLGYRLAKLVRRHPWSSAAAILAIVATLVFALYAREQARILAQERDRAQRVAEFLTEVFSVSDPERAQGESITARELLARGVSRAEKDLVNQPALAADFLATLGRTHRNLGDYSTANSLFERVLDLHQNQLDSAPEEIARASIDLAQTQRLIGNYQAAEDLLTDVIARVEPGADGDDAQLHAEALSRLGRVLGVRGKNEQSFEMLKRSLAITRRLPQLSDLTLATRLNDMASASFRAGRFSEAQSMLSESLNLHRRMDRRDQITIGRPETATALNNLGLAHYLQGHHEQAEPLFREALSMRQSILATNHPEVAQTQTNLGLLLRDLGRFEEAEAALGSALEIRRHSLDQHHPLVAQALNNLAMVKESQGQFEQSEDLFRQSLSGLVEHFGAEHPSVASAQTNLGRMLLSADRPDEALPLFSRSLQIRKQALPPNHPYLAWSLVGLARTHLDLGNADSALPLAREALEIRIVALPKDDPLVGEARLALGRALMMLGEHEPAGIELRQSFEILKDHRAYASEVSQLESLLAELAALEPVATDS